MSSKAVIGLSWEPKLPGLIPSSSPSLGALSGGQIGPCEGESSALWRPNSELVDGLFVPPNNPRKLNKMLRKQVKDTAGSSWYVHRFSSVACFCYYVNVKGD